MRDEKIALVVENLQQVERVKMSSEVVKKLNNRIGIGSEEITLRFPKIEIGAQYKINDCIVEPIKIINSFVVVKIIKDDCLKKKIGELVEYHRSVALRWEKIC